MAPLPNLIFIGDEAHATSGEATTDTTVRISYANALSDLSKYSNGSVDEAKIASNAVPGEDLLGKLLQLLKADGKLAIEGIPDREAGQAVSLDLKILGFVDIIAAKDPASGERFVVCKKPSWDLGSSAPIKLSATTVTDRAPLRRIGSTLFDESIPAAGSVEANEIDVKTWKMDFVDLADEELIDEDMLVEDLSAPVAAKAGCGEEVAGVPGKRRACKNCSCGLADDEAAEVDASKRAATIEEKVAAASSCGGCYKGDAFRCARCPYLGMPAFEQGNERVVLSMDMSDI